MARVVARSGASGAVLGVRFEGGVVEVPEGPALAYFRRSPHYAVEDVPEPPPPPPAPPAGKGSGKGSRKP